MHASYLTDERPQPSQAHLHDLARGGRARGRALVDMLAPRGLSPSRIRAVSTRGALGQRVGQVVGLASVAALVMAVGALAVSGYSVSVRAHRKVTRGHTFAIRVTGNAPRRSIVNIWLDPKSCAPTAQSEGTRPGYKSGDSYFIDQAGGGARVNYSSQPYQGSFTDNQTAHAGTHLGKQHLCVYVNELDAGPNNSRASASRTYRITQ